MGKKVDKDKKRGNREARSKGGKASDAGQGGCGWLQERLGTALSIPPETVNRVLRESSTRSLQGGFDAQKIDHATSGKGKSDRNGNNNNNAEHVSQLFLPYGPEYDAKLRARRSAAKQAREEKEKALGLPLSLQQSVLQPKSLVFLREQQQLKEKQHFLGFSYGGDLEDLYGCDGHNNDDESKSQYSGEESESEDEKSQFVDKEKESNMSVCSSRSNHDLQIDTTCTMMETDRKLYLEACKALHVHPISYVIDSLDKERILLGQHLVGEQGAIAIARALKLNEYITSLSLVSTNIGAKAALALGEMLRFNRHLVFLDVSDNILGNVGGAALMRALEANHTLRSLSMSNTKFGDSAVAVLSSSLVNNSSNSLVRLDISKNQTTAKGATLLSDVLASNHSLTHLDLGWNNLRGRGAAAIADAVASNSMSAVKLLNLSWNGVDDEAGESVARLIESSKVLKVLDLAHNRLTQRTSSLIAASISSTGSLRSLQLGFNPLGSDGCIHLIKHLTTNHTIRLLGVENSFGSDVNCEQMNEFAVEVDRMLDERDSFAQVVIEHPPRHRDLDMSSLLATPR